MTLKLAVGFGRREADTCQTSQFLAPSAVTGAGAGDGAQLTETVGAAWGRLCNLQPPRTHWNDLSSVEPAMSKQPLGP